MSTPNRHALLPLVALVIQNASIVLIVAFTRQHQQPYASSVVVAITEAIKASVSLLMLAREVQKTAVAKDKDIGLVHSVLKAASESMRDGSALLRMSVPAALYAIQNNLNFYALSNLPSPVYHVSYQSRILATALIGTLAFQQRMSTLKWIALLLLFAGVAIVQLDSQGIGNERSHTATEQKQTLGLLAVAVACTTSGFAGCYFEWLLRGSPTSRRAQPSLWARNVQLAFPCLLFALVAVAFDHSLRLRSIFSGFTWLVWLVVLDASLGGLLVAVVVRNSGAVAKGFATSLAIILSTVVHAIATRQLPGQHFLLGAIVVVGATMLYSVPT